MAFPVRVDTSNVVTITADDTINAITARSMIASQVLHSRGGGGEMILSSKIMVAADKPRINAWKMSSGAAYNSAWATHRVGCTLQALAKAGVSPTNAVGRFAKEFRNDLKDPIVQTIWGKHLAPLLAALHSYDDNAKNVLMEHNATIAKMVRQSNQKFRAASAA